MVDHRPSEPVSTKEPVDHWDSKHYGGESYEPRQDFVMELSDQRLWNGQLFVGLSRVQSDQDEGLTKVTSKNIQVLMPKPARH